MLPNWSCTQRVSTVCLNLQVVVHVSDLGIVHIIIWYITSWNVRHIICIIKWDATIKFQIFYLLFVPEICTSMWSLSKTSFPVRQTTSYGFVSKAGKSLFSFGCWTNIWSPTSIWLYFAFLLLSAYSFSFFLYVQSFTQISSSSLSLWLALEGWEYFSSLDIGKWVCSVQLQLLYAVCFCRLIGILATAILQSNSPILSFNMSCPDSF